MKKLITKYLLTVAVALGAVSCIHNDIPYPRLDCTLSSISTEGLKEYTTSTKGDTTIITLDIDESVDLREVPFLAMSFSNQDKGSIVYADKSYGTYPTEGDKWNLREGVMIDVVIYGYHNLFKVVGTQSVEYGFRVEGQMGRAYFEENVAGAVENRIALLNVPEGTDMSAINVLELKLGPEGETTYIPEISGVMDFTSATGDDQIKEVRVIYRDVEQVWRIIVRESSVAMNNINAWALSADVEAIGAPDDNHAIEYRAKGSSEWQNVPLTYDQSGLFITTITGLTAETEYECRALSGGDYTDAILFKTEAAPMLENGGFESWHRSSSNSNLWLPYAEDDAINHTFTDPVHPGEVFESRFWDTGNRGAITMGSSNSIPLSEALAKGFTDTTPYEGEDAAFLQSKFVGVGVAGKLAGGNIFTGTFGVVQGTNGTTYLGIPFTARPKRLVGYYKYVNTPISHFIKSDFISKEWVGKPDTLNMVIALGDWELPHEVCTDPKNRVEFNRKTSGLVAWGNFASAEEKSEWTRFDIPLEYFDKEKKPRYLTIMCTASKWSDYFTGGSGSALIIDDLRIEYE